MQWLDSLIDIGLATGTLEADDIAPIRACFATRGPRKGRILANAPSCRTDPLRAAAWQAIMSAVAPVRVGIGMIFCLPPQARAAFNRIEAWTSIDTVMRALNSYGQHPYEFNMFDGSGASDPDDFARRVQIGIDTYLAKSAYA